jgi:hypothetical protein
MGLREGYLHDYLVASFIGLAFGAVVAGTAALKIGDWGPYIGIMFVAGIFGFIPSGFVASYINFRFHQMGENTEMAGLSAGFFAAFVYLIVDLVIALTFAIVNTAAAANYFIGWVISIVFGFIFIPIGGYLSGVFERRPFAMPGFFDLSHVSRAPPPPPPTAAAQLCPTCGKPLTFVQQYKRWYCPNCRKYP